jgi:hypothetical protein
MLAVADAMAPNTGLAGPFLAVDQHVGVDGTSEDSSKNSRETDVLYTEQARLDSKLV